MSSETHSPLPLVRRVITGHTPDGKSVFLEDTPVEPHRFGPASFFSDLYWTDEFPADNGVGFEDLAKDHPQDLISPNGSSFRTTEIPPGHFSPFHRTVSLDYGVVMKGELTLYLDDNKKVILKEGDVVIQRGTIHAWKNEGKEWARMYCILFPSDKVKIGNKELGTEFRPLTK